MRYFFCCSFAVFLCPSASLYAEALKSIHVVDMQRNIEGDIKKKEAQLQKLQGDLKAMKADLDKQASLLSADAIKGKQESFVKKEREFQRAFQDHRDELGKKNNEAIGNIVKEIDSIIKEIASENGYQIVVEKDSRFVVYAASQLDISDQVIKTLDKKKLD